MTTSAVSIGGLSLIGDSLLGGRWRVQSVDGWYSRAIGRNRVPRAQSDGDWPSTGVTNALTMTVKGSARFGSAADAKTASRALLALQGSASVPMVVTDALGTMQRMVEVDAVSTPPVRDRLVDWTVVVTAVDPLLYGLETFSQTTLEGSVGDGWQWPVDWPVDWGVPEGTTPGSVSVANAGTAAYWPRLRIDGPVTNPVVQVVETGAWVKYAGVVASGQWLNVLAGDRRVLLNGQVSRRALVSSSGDWLRVPVGGGSVSWTADDADPAAVLSVWGYEGAWW